MELRRVGGEKSAGCTRSSASLANAFTGSFSSPAACTCQPPSPSPHCLWAPREACCAVVHSVYLVEDNALCDTNGTALRTVRLAESLIPVTTKTRRPSDRQPKEPPGITACDFTFFAMYQAGVSSASALAKDRFWRLMRDNADIMKVSASISGLSSGFYVNRFGQL